MNNYLNYYNKSSLIKTVDRYELNGATLVESDNSEYQSKLEVQFDTDYPELFNTQNFSNEFSPKSDYMLNMKDTLILGDTMYLVNEDGLLRQSVGGQFSHNRLGSLIGQEVERVVDDPVLIVGNTAYKNYFHWTMQGLLALLHFKDVTKNRDIKIITPKLNSWRASSLEVFGIRQAQIIEIDTDELVLLKNCYYSAYSSRAFGYTMSKYGRKLFVNHQMEAKNSEKFDKFDAIYINRKSARRRRLENEEDIERFLEAKGYISVTLESLSVVEQISLFRSAKKIVAPHGAGLVNLLYSAEGNPKTLVELMPHDYVNPCFFRLSQTCGFDYRCVVGDMVERKNRHDSSWNVSISKLEETLFA